MTYEEAMQKALGMFQLQAGSIIHSTYNYHGMGVYTNGTVEELKQVFLRCLEIVKEPIKEQAYREHALEVLKAVKEESIRARLAETTEEQQLDNIVVPD